MKDILADLKWRGLIHQTTDEQHLSKWLADGSRVLYIGFDPTADSLHVGGLLQLLLLRRFQRMGHRPIALVGGATGMIGDPSGKSQERILLDQEQVERNVEGLRTQIARFLDFERPDNPAMLVNNADWLASISLVDFLRDTGKYFTVNYMMAKESVKRRLDSEDGLSFTEFSYMLLQAHDFLVLYDRYGCKMQMGGSDQWGNILAGADLVRRLRSERVHGIVFPLVVTASGTKFGKTEEGTIWLDAARTSPYKFYQFWLNTDDRDVPPYLRFFTWLEEEEINALEQELLENPGNRSAQIRLAEEVTRVVHGPEELEKAQAASSVLFGGEVSAMRAADLMEVFEDVPSTEMERAVFDESGIDIVQLISDAGLVASRGEARRLVRGGGINVNNRRINDENHRVSLDDAIEQRILVLRRGQKTYRLVKIV